MNMKHIIILANCLIFATPAQSFSYAQQEGEKGFFSITKNQALTAATLSGFSVACIISVLLNHTPLSTLSKVMLSKSSLIPGMIGGSAGLATGQSVYHLLYNKKPGSPDMYGQVNINITR